MIPITSPETLGKVLRRYRKDLGMTQTEVGQKFNLTQKVVSNIEAGKDGVQIATIFRYMSALGLEMLIDSRNKHPEEAGLW